MGIVNGGLALARDLLVSSGVEMVVDTAEDVLTARAPHRPLPEVRFTHPDRTLHDILAKSKVDASLWNHSGNDPAHASTADGPQVAQWLKPAVIIEAWAASAALHPVHLAHPLARRITHLQG
jgi:hypothetical protein